MTCMNKSQMNEAFCSSPCSRIVTFPRSLEYLHTQGLEGASHRYFDKQEHSGPGPVKLSASPW